MTSRRQLLRLIPLAGCAAVLPFAAEAESVAGRAKVRISTSTTGAFRPLDRLHVESPIAGRLVLRDGDQQIYLDEQINGGADIIVGGALGTHSVTLLSSRGEVLDFQTFSVDCTTELDDEGGVFSALLKDAYWTMASDGPVTAMRYKGEVFTCWDTWLQDNTNTLKGMKYFWPEVKSNVDFYVNSQREDGMIWENFEPRTPPESDWDRRFKFGDFTRSAEGGFLELRRAPVENHVEHFLLEAIYFSWKASGDTPWMTSRLDSAIRAVHYSMTDAYRWSTKYQLLKRGFTIDTWDFLCESEAKLVDGDIMAVKLGQTHFGIFFGDNANMIAGLRRLAEMLDAAGRNSDAPAFRAMADGLEKRLNALCWNGEFFTHWIPEDQDLKFDMGVDISRQVALSNAYSLNRGISHEQCVAIVRTYQRIRKEMPASSPGEFYSIYPPFESGFGAENAKWEYMNGGVMSCTAGELARGSFDHGFESYGVDILRREKLVADRYHGIIPAILRGETAEAPSRSFTTVDLRKIANADFGSGAPGVPGWTSEPGNDLESMPAGRQVFREVPFDVIDPKANGHRALVAVSSAEGYIKKVAVPIHAKAKSFYLLHALSGDDLGGKLTVRYEDGSSHFEYIRATSGNIGHWWAPHDLQFELRYGPTKPEKLQVAWRGANQQFGNVGVYVAGFDHPDPEKTIAALEFESMETSAKWLVLGVTLSNGEMFLPPWNDLSFGMPNNWGAAALVYALLEGLAGVRDTGVAFDKAGITPRWIAAEVNHAEITVRYPASRGYVRYRYHFDEAALTMMLEFTSNAEQMQIELLLPEGKFIRAARLDGKQVEVEMVKIEGSHYVHLQANVRGPHILELELA